MNDKLFDELLESVREVAAIIRGDSDKPYWVRVWPGRSDCYMIGKTRYGQIDEMIAVDLPQEYCVKFTLPLGTGVDAKFIPDLKTAKEWIERLYKEHYVKANTDVIE